MDVWRLASSRHDPLSGEGARRAGGRWNSPGHPVVYGSESLSLCLVEALVHIPGSLPADYRASRIAVPDETIERLDASLLGRRWREDIGFTRAIGDQWVEQARSLALVVPSAVLPAGANVLLNPEHPAFGSVQVLSAEPFTFDARLR